MTTVISEAWFDEDGEPLDGPEFAATGEIHAVDEDGVETRTYVDLHGASPDDVDSPAVASADYLGPENQDALKGGTWDVWMPDYARTVESRDELLGAFGWLSLTPAQQRSQVCHLMELPIWDAAPKVLKDEVYAWLEATRSE